MGFTWPVWLPYPISWARAFANLFVASVIGKASSTALMDAIRDGEIDDPGELMAVVTVLAVVSLLFHFLFIVLGHHCISKLVLQRSAWFPGWLSWREGLTGFVVLVLQSMGTGFFVFYLAVMVMPRTEEQVRLFVGLVGAGLLAISAYLYHYDFLVRERRAARKIAKRSQAQSGNKKRGKGGNSSPSVPANSTPPPDPIEQELNQMRADLGLNQMRRRQKPPGNSQ